MFALGEELWESPLWLVLAVWVQAPTYTRMIVCGVKGDRRKGNNPFNKSRVKKLGWMDSERKGRNRRLLSYKTLVGVVATIAGPSHDWKGFSTNA